jgi:hypothetical protein
MPFNAHGIKMLRELKNILLFLAPNYQPLTRWHRIYRRTACMFGWVFVRLKIKTIWLLRPIIGNFLSRFESLFDTFYLLQDQLGPS